MQEPILKPLSAEFERDPQINVHSHPIDMKLEGNQLVLSGEVDSIGAKRRALALAGTTLPQYAILDEIRLTPGETRAEDEMREIATRHLNEEPVFHAYALNTRDEYGNPITIQAGDGAPNQTIDLNVSENTITLAGRVGSLTHQRLAEVLMWWVPGCTFVQNGLEVDPPENDNGELADAVAMVLEKDPLVHESQVTVREKGGTIILRGSVANDEERRFAELDAWYVPGIQNVVNEIESRS